VYLTEMLKASGECGGRVCCLGSCDHGKSCH